MFLRRKKKLEVDLSEFEDEKESLPSFLRSHMKADVTSSGNRVLIDSEKTSTQELKRLVNKFVYHRNLNNRYYVTLEKHVVKLIKLEGAKKREKRKKKTTPPSTIKHGW